MANDPLTFKPETVVLCGQTSGGDIIPIRTANAAGFDALTYKPKYLLACGRSDAGEIVPLEVDSNGDVI